MVAFFGALLAIELAAYQGWIPAALGQLPAYDTVAHFLLLGLGGLVAHLGLGRRTSWGGLPIGPAAVGALAIAQEAFQALSPHRSASLTDLGADAAGIVFFWAIDATLRRRRRVRATAS